MHALLKLAVLILAGSNALAADALHLGGVQGGHAQVVFAAAPNDEQLLAHQPVRFDQHRLVRFHEVSRAMAALRRMEEETGETVDIWGYVVDEKKRRGNSAQMTMTTAVDVRLSTEQLQRLVEWTSVPRAMNGSGIVSRVPTLRYTIVEQNVQAAIDEESVRLRRSKNDGLLQDKKKTWFEEYHRFDEIVEWYKDLAATYPELVTFIDSIGKTHEGRDMFALKLTSPKGDRNIKPQIYYQSQIHAREWISGATVQYVVNEMLAGYGKDAEYTRMLDTVEFIVVPVVNPDGYEFTWTTNRLWRKNRRENGSKLAYGVDLNRNFNAHWELDNGASRSPASETYKGPAVASEPETQAISNFFLSHPRIIAGIDFHSYSQLLLRPYGHTTKDSPHEAEHAAIGKIMSEIIEKQHGKVYTSMKSSELYAATGTANDWFYSEEVREKLGHNAYGFTIELRPRNGLGAGGFVLPPSQIIPTGEEIAVALQHFVDFVVKNPLY